MSKKKFNPKDYDPITILQKKAMEVWGNPVDMLNEKERVLRLEAAHRLESAIGTLVKRVRLNLKRKIQEAEERIK